MHLYGLPSVYRKRSRNKITTLKFEIMKKIKKFIRWYCDCTIQFYGDMIKYGVPTHM